MSSWGALGRVHHPVVAALAFCVLFVREGFVLPEAGRTACTVLLGLAAVWLAVSRLRQARQGDRGRGGVGAYLVLLVATQVLRALVGGGFSILAAVAAFVGMEGFLLILLFGNLVAALRLTPARAMLAGFALLVLIGTLLLWLPRAGREPLSLQDAFFQATSAVCVTGLSTLDVGADLSPLGQTILLLLIQVGGIGIMTIAFFALMAGREALGLREQAMLRDLVPSEGRATSEILPWILGLTLVIEAIGAAALYASGDPDTGHPAAFSAVFHSVSAFCNAGFSLHPDSVGSVPRLALSVYALLIVLGGLGFTVLLELTDSVWRRLRGSRGEKAAERRGLSVHARLVLWTSGLLIVAGAVVLAAVESGNPKTLGELPLGDRVLRAVFQSVTARTAGFTTVDPADLRESSVALTYALMCVGASPGSTGGGIKTVVAAVAFLTVVSVLRRRPAVIVFGRSLPTELTLKAIAMVSVYGATLWVVSFALMLCAGPEVPFRDLSFEAASAMGTVGLSTGVTPDLPLSARLVLCAAMFLGRIGPLAFVVSWSSETRAPLVEYPAGHVHLG